MLLRQPFRPTGPENRRRRYVAAFELVNESPRQGAGRGPLRAPLQGRIARAAFQGRISGPRFFWTLRSRPSRRAKTPMDGLMHGHEPDPGRAAKGASLQSEYADDPDMREIVEFFVNDLTARMNSIREAFTRDDRARLKTLAHQLKGAAGGYGFPTIGTAAGAVERELLGSEADLSHLQDKVEDLIRLCRSAIPGEKDGSPSA
jgi:HPt (histidine-containing phosphotransfer) domain-containing protein